MDNILNDSENVKPLDSGYEDVKSSKGGVSPSLVYYGQNSASKNPDDISCCSSAKCFSPFFPAILSVPGREKLVVFISV